MGQKNGNGALIEKDHYSGYKLNGTYNPGISKGPVRPVYIDVPNGNQIYRPQYF